MENKMFETVNRLLEEYIGGQIFFSQLDAAVKFDPGILWEFVDSVYPNFGECKTIASGEIALSMHNLGVLIDLIVPGGLRFDSTKINLEPFTDSIQGQKFVFIDDSFFSGRTQLVVKEEIERCGGIFLGSMVAYDGCKTKEPTVKSLYRYFDHYDILGRPIRDEEENYREYEED